MRLYGSYTSPYVRHCRIVLAVQRQPCEFVPWDYDQSREHSPTMRVPLLEHEEFRLTDSASIIRHLREQAGRAFMPDVREYDLFLLANTILDTLVNLFLLERDGLGPDASAYLARQRDRSVKALDHLDQIIADWPDWLPADGDAALRIGCLLSWAQFRQRIELAHWSALAAFQRRFEADPTIAATHPAAPPG
ncbi:MAG: hypothetical protein Kow0020_16020 [Wenzhouxiangellaceae bacterium]